MFEICKYLLSWLMSKLENEISFQRTSICCKLLIFTFTNAYSSIKLLKICGLSDRLNSFHFFVVDFKYTRVICLA